MKTLILALCLLMVAVPVLANVPAFPARLSVYKVAVVGYKNGLSTKEEFLNYSQNMVADIGSDSSLFQMAFATIVIATAEGWLSLDTATAAMDDMLKTYGK